MRQGGIDDLKKARWYLDRAIDNLEHGAAEAEVAEGAECIAHVFVGDYCRDCGLHAPRVDVDPPRADGVVIRIPGAELFIEQPQPTQTTACACSPKYRELAPGTHAKYCPLAGLPLEDGRKRWRCDQCDLTFRRAVDEVEEAGPVENCLQCDGPTTEVR